MAKERDNKKMDIEEPVPELAPEPKRARITDPLSNDINNYQQGLNRRANSRENRRHSGNSS